MSDKWTLKRVLVAEHNVHEKIRDICFEKNYLWLRQDPPWTEQFLSEKMVVEALERGFTEILFVCVCVCVCVFLLKKVIQKAS